MANEKLVTHYDNLKVANNAPLAVIRAAYRALVQQNHPDKCPDQALAERRIKIINKAFEVLSDTEKRRAHDAWIAEQRASRAAGDAARAGLSAHEPGANQGAGADGDALQARHAAASTGRWRGLCSIRARVMQFGGVVERLALIGGIALLAYVFLAQTPAPAVKAGAPTADPAPAAIFSPPDAASPDPAAMAEATRCFWIYAPIAQVGREFPHDGLFQFAQVRVRWFDAFFEAHKDNPEFARAIEYGLYRYKPDATLLHDALGEALATHNRQKFALALDAASACDQSLGIPTRFVPRM